MAKDKATEATELDEMRTAPSYPTGSDQLDLMVGGGVSMGYPAGMIINIVGDKSTGKTFLACEIIAAARHKFGPKHFKWVYDDAESGFGFDTTHLYGFEIMPMDEKDRYQSATVEDWYCNFRTFLESLGPDDFGVYVLDSLDGLTSDEMEKRGDKRMAAFKAGTEFKEGSYQMGAAKFLSQEFFRGLTRKIRHQHVLLVIISQIRYKVDVLSMDKWERAGGKALDFYAHTVMWLASIYKQKYKGLTYGVLIRARTTKSKTPRPFRETDFTLLFDYGLDNIGSDIDYLFDLRTEEGKLKKKADGSPVCVQWNGKPVTVEALKEFLERVGQLEEYKKTDKTFKKSKLLDWIEAHPELNPAYQVEFGTEMTRDQLIEYIETNKKQQELTDKVVAKWEALEAEIKSHRARKYE